MACALLFGNLKTLEEIDLRHQQYYCTNIIYHHGLRRPAGYGLTQTQPTAKGSF